MTRSTPRFLAPPGHYRSYPMLTHRIPWFLVSQEHHDEVIMSAMASQITSLTIVYSIVYSGTDQRKHQSSASLAFVQGNSPVTGEFPAQRASRGKGFHLMTSSWHQLPWYSLRKINGCLFSSREGDQLPTPSCSDPSRKFNEWGHVLDMPKSLCTALPQMKTVFHLCYASGHWDSKKIQTSFIP